MSKHPNPTVPGVTQVDPIVRRAYWDALTLLDHGWQLRKVRFQIGTGLGALDVHTPSHRAVTILSANPTIALPFPGADRAHRLAHDVATLGHRGDDSLTDLQWALSDQIKSTSLTPQPRRDMVPDPTLSKNRAHQSINLRTGFWMLATLVVDYGWHVSNIGDEVAGGGFIADIPSDTTAVFPASMALDATTAAQLARLIPKLKSDEREYLRRLTAADLAAALAAKTTPIR